MKRFYFLLILMVLAFTTAPAYAASLAAVVTPAVKATYGYAEVNKTPAATPTDFATIYGSATKTIVVKRVSVSGVATTAGTMDVSLVKRTAANTGGTVGTSATVARYDSLQSANTATVAFYSANPSALGTGATIATAKLNFGVAGAAGTQTFDFGNRFDKAVILRGSTQGLAINFNGDAVPTGGAVSVYIEWEEY